MVVALLSIWLMICPVKNVTQQHNEVRDAERDLSALVWSQVT